MENPRWESDNTYNLWSSLQEIKVVYLVTLVAANPDFAIL